MYWLRRARRALGRGFFLASVPPVRRWLRGRWERADDVPPVGLVRFGDLRTLEPVSRSGGDDRGGSIRRYYIDAFLGDHCAAMCGAVLEIDAGDDAAAAEPASADCSIMTHSLEHACDPRALVHATHRSLRPGGVALVTAGGIAPNGRAGNGHAPASCWQFTALSLGRLFGEIFGPENVAVTTYGNVLSAAAVLQGLGSGELSGAELDHHDPDYEVVIGVRAQRSGPA